MVTEIKNRLASFYPQDDSEKQENWVVDGQAGRKNKRYSLKYRSDRKTWQFTLHEESGLAPEVCAQWRSKSFSTIPPAILSRFPNIRTRTGAERIVDALIEHLKGKEDAHPVVTHGTPVWEWINLFTKAETSPKAKKLIMQGKPYSPDTIRHMESLVRTHFDAKDPLMQMAMERVTSEDLTDFFATLAQKQFKDRPRLHGGDRTETIMKSVGDSSMLGQVYGFLRMTFHEFQLSHKRYYDPFVELERPHYQGPRREGLEEEEVLKLFTVPGVFVKEPELERAVCAAIFWAGLRRSEVFALQSDDLDWKTPKINLQHAWKKWDTVERKIGDPKHHKLRAAPFPDVLQKAIRDLWKVNGQHQFVIARADGSQPGAKWYRDHVYKWFERAGIDIRGRRITPHSSRHSLASILESEGVPLRYIQDLLGHSDLETTLGYLHTPQGKINEITNKINNQ